MTSPTKTNDRTIAQLRILATTDIHMQLTGFDYVTDRQKAVTGLAGVGSLIEQARQEALAQNRACILLDNGDLLQGTPMAHHLAQKPVTPDHPAIASINALHYDALGVGNHDLDFGLPYLQQVASHLNAPVISSNLKTPDISPLRNAVLIDCKLPETTSPTPLRVGVLSVLPQQTAMWNHHWLEGHTHVAPAFDCLQQAVPALRAQGADLVVVLAHMGIAEDGEDRHDTALELAQIPGIDAMIAGHTHRRFPGSDHRHGGGVDTALGKLLDVPTVMPGHGGSDLGVLDLDLGCDAQGRWVVTGHTSRLMENTPQTVPVPAIMSATDATHTDLRSSLAASIGATRVHLHNYFSLAAPTSTGAFAARAKARLVRAALAGTADASLPLLSSAAAHTTGGREGPDHYLSIPKGNMQRRHLAGLNPYNNQIWALRINGTELRNWLEHAASVFNDLSEERPAAMLLRPDTPAFNFEAIYGVTYTIDPTQPVGQRIGHLSRDGVPVRAGQMFVLATNQFRAAGGGGYEVFADDHVVLRLPGSTDEMYIDALANPFDILWDNDTPWQFATPVPVHAELQTAPCAARFLGEIAHLEPRCMGNTEDGFLRLQLTL